MIPAYTICKICESYEAVGRLCSFSSYSLFCAIDAETEEFVMSKDYYEKVLTEEKLHELIKFLFNTIQRRLTIEK
jgi:hypothetical protein